MSPSVGWVGVSRTCRARRAAVVVSLALAALLLSACGAKQDVITPAAARPLSVMLDHVPNAEHAALYAAIAHGDFRAAGLDVRPQVPSDPSAPLKLLAAGRVDMAISHEPELLAARDQGLPLVAIGALIQRPLSSIIALPGAHVRGIADLGGKRVGTAGIGYQSAMLKTVLRGAGVNPASVAEINVGFNLVAAMVSKQVAATLGGFWNYEGIGLTLTHQRPLVIPVDQAGVPTYDELVLVVRRDEARRRGEDLRAFLQALTRGEAEVRADPVAAADLVLQANPSLDGQLQSESIVATLPAALPPAGEPFGYQVPSQWAAFGRWMLSHGLLAHDPAVGAPPFTNEFLPGQGI